MKSGGFMKNEMLCKLKSLVLFRNLLNDPVVSAFCRLCEVPNDFDTAKVEAWGAFAAELLKQNKSLSRYLLQQVLADENLYTEALLAGKGGEQDFETMLRRELEILSTLATYTGDDIPADLKVYCPCCWQTETIDFYSRYKQHIAHINETGFGIFAKYSAFTAYETPQHRIKGLQ